MRFRIALATVLVGLPLGVLAAFQQPSDLLQSVQYSGQPVDLSVEIHAHALTYFGTVVIKGAMQGSTPKDAKGILHVSAELVNGSEKARAQVQIRVKDGVAYFLVEQLTGTFQKNDVSSAYGTLSHKWFSAPLNPSQVTGASAVSEAEVKDVLAAIINGFFKMDMSTTATGRLYSLTPRTDAPDAIAAALKDLQKKYPTVTPPNAGDNEAKNKEMLRKFLSHLDLHIKIDTDTNDKFLHSKCYIALTSDPTMIPADGTLLSEVTVRSSDVTVFPPQNAIPINQEQPPSRSLSSASSSSAGSVCSGRTLCGSRPPRSAR